MYRNTEICFVLAFIIGQEKEGVIYSSKISCANCCCISTCIDKACQDTFLVGISNLKTLERKYEKITKIFILEESYIIQNLSYEIHCLINVKYYKIDTNDDCHS